MVKYYKARNVDKLRSFIKAKIEKGKKKLFLIVTWRDEWVWHLCLRYQRFWWKKNIYSLISKTPKVIASSPPTQLLSLPLRTFPLTKILFIPFYAKENEIKKIFCAKKNQQILFLQTRTFLTLYIHKIYPQQNKKKIFIVFKFSLRNQT